MANLPGGGRGLGMASGAIRIDTSDLNRVEQTVERVGQRVNRSLSQTGRGAAELDRNFRDVAVAARQLATAVDRAFGNVERSADRATAKVSRMNRALLQGASTFAGTALGGTAGGIAGALAFGQPAIAAGLALGQASRAAQDQVATSIQSASDLTESINKVGVAFDQSGREILDWSKNSATALGQSRQQALEAASSFGLLFRTMGIAPEESARMSEALVQLAADMASINNISPEEALTKLRAGLVGEIEPLRAVGVLLDAAATEAKAMELGLASSTNALTQQDKVMARYQLILEQTALTQGDFSRTSRDAANLQRILAAQVKDFNTELGKTILPGYVILLQGATTAMSRLNTIVETGTGAVEKYARAWREVISFIRLLSGGASLSTAIDLAISRPIPAGTSRTGQRLAAGRSAQSGDTGGFTDDQTRLIVDRQRQIDAIERNANEARQDATEQYESQRTSIITRYERTIAREAEDFARQRARAEQQLVRDIAEVREDAADRQIEIERQLSRRVEDIQEQLADRQGDIRERLGEREADIREQVGKRLLDIEEDYQRNRERATRDHRDNLLDAASRLDARAIFEEQRRFKRQQEDLLEARDDQVEQAQEGAEEQLEQARENADRQLEQAQEAADDQLEQAREAAQEQLDQQRRQAEERIQELNTEFEDRKRIEDEDRTIRLNRMAEDHQDQLDEQARQHGVRLQQISDQEQEERELLDAEFQKSLSELELQTDAWIKEQERLTERAIENFDKWWEAVNRRFGIIPPPLPSTGGHRRELMEFPEFQHGGFVPRDMVARLHAGEFVVPRHQVQNMGGISIIVQGGPGGEGTAIAVRNELESLLRSFGGV